MRSARSQTFETFRQYLRGLNLRDARSILKEIAEATLRRHSRRDGSSSVARTVQCIPHSSTACNLKVQDWQLEMHKIFLTYFAGKECTILGEYSNLGHLRPRLC